MVMLLMYLFAVCLSGHVAEANGGHAGHCEVERSHVHRELRRTTAHLIKELALVTKFVNKIFCTVSHVYFLGHYYSGGFSLKTNYEIIVH